MRGGLTVGIDDRVSVPQPGDSICFESWKRHHTANKGRGMTTAVWVNAVPWIFTHGWRAAAGRC